MFIPKLLQILLFGPGVRYVPDSVWQSKFFWIALVVMMVGILFYHNAMISKKEYGSVFIKLFGLFGSRISPNGAKILYSSDGRSGHVHYVSAETEFAMYYEFSGGDCIVAIDIPSPEDWESTTKLPLARREEVLNFIGWQVVKDQTTGGRGSFKIEGNWLNIYS